ncbi:hypothetical protein L596_019670 [Steinernema carpocapsae]|uniref:MADF domain-containing protein n=1 Tax=Steinernema carpocapsae TaxID=34508 RepID=A0A4V6A0S0_STECR|nr:hypothetical protein L596_019670 [Steinernema carpocapsae]
MNSLYLTGEKQAAWSRILGKLSVQGNMHYTANEAYNAWYHLRDQYCDDVCDEEWRGKIPYLNALLGIENNEDDEDDSEIKDEEEEEDEMMEEEEDDPAEDVLLNADTEESGEDTDSEEVIDLQPDFPSTSSSTPVSHKEYLANKYGDAALQLLIDVMGNFPDIYQMKLKSSAELSMLQDEFPDSWSQVMAAMRTSYPDVSEECVFRAWKSLRITYFSARASKKTAGKIAYLNALMETPQKPEVDTYAPQISSSKSAIKRGIDSIPTTSRQPDAVKTPTNSKGFLSNLYGEKAVEQMIKEVGKYPAIYTLSAYNEASSLEGVKEMARGPWNKVMTAMRKNYPSVSEDVVFRAWKHIKRSYTNQKCPQKYAGKIDYLNALYDHVSDDESEGDSKPERQYGNKNTLFIMFGGGACDLLISEIGKYKEFYSYPVSHRLTIEDMPKHVLTLFRKIYRTILTAYPGVTEELVFKFWKGLKSKYNTKQCSLKYAGKIGYLNEHFGLAEPEKEEEEEEKDEPEEDEPETEEDAPEEDVKPDTNETPKGGSNSNTLFRLFGAEACDLLIDEIGKYKEFYTHRLSTNEQRIEDLPSGVLECFKKIYRTVETAYPGVPEDLVFSAWKTLRKKYNTRVCSKRYAGKIGYLNEFFAQLKAENQDMHEDEIETPRPQRSLRHQNQVKEENQSHKNPIETSGPSRALRHQNQVKVENESHEEPIETPGPSRSLRHQNHVKEENESREDSIKTPGSSRVLHHENRSLLIEESGLREKEPEEDVKSETVTPRGSKSNTIFRLFGEDACNLLIDEIGKYKEFYSYRLWTNCTIDDLTSGVLEHFKKICETMSAAYPGVTEELVFKFWKSLKSKYNSKQCPSRYARKIGYLNEFFGLTELEDKPEEEQEKEDKPRTSQDVTSETVTPGRCGNTLYRLFGEEACDLLVDEVGNYKEFYWHYLPISATVDDLPSRVLTCFRKIYGTMLAAYPEVTEDVVFNAWKTLRKKYNTSVCSKRYAGKIGYLNEFFAQLKAENLSQDDQIGTSESSRVVRHQIRSYQNSPIPVVKQEEPTETPGLSQASHYQNHVQVKTENPSHEDPTATPESSRVRSHQDSSTPVVKREDTSETPGSSRSLRHQNRSHLIEALDSNPQEGKTPKKRTCSNVPWITRVGEARYQKLIEEVGKYDEFYTVQKAKLVSISSLNPKAKMAWKRIAKEVLKDSTEVTEETLFSAWKDFRRYYSLDSGCKQIKGYKMPERIPYLDAVLRIGKSSVPATPRAPKNRSRHSSSSDESVYEPAPKRRPAPRPSSLSSRSGRRVVLLSNLDNSRLGNVGATEKFEEFYGHEILLFVFREIEKEKEFYTCNLRGCRSPRDFKGEIQAAFDRIVKNVNSSHETVTALDIYKAWSSIRKNYFNEHGKNNPYWGRLKFLNDLRHYAREHSDHSEEEENQPQPTLANSDKVSNNRPIQEAPETPQEIPKSNSRLRTNLEEGLTAADQFEAAYGAEALQLVLQEVGKEKLFYSLSLSSCNSHLDLSADSLKFFARIVSKVNAQLPNVTPLDIFKVWASIRRHYFDEQGRTHKFHGKVAFLNELEKDMQPRKKNRPSSVPTQTSVQNQEGSRASTSQNVSYAEASEESIQELPQERPAESIPRTLDIFDTRSNLDDRFRVSNFEKFEAFYGGEIMDFAIQEIGKDKKFYAFHMQGKTPRNMTPEIQRRFEKIMIRVNARYPDVTPFDLYKGWACIRRDYFNMRGRSQKLCGKIPYLNAMKSSSRKSQIQNDPELSESNSEDDDDHRFAPEVQNTAFEHLSRMDGRSTIAASQRFEDAYGTEVLHLVFREIEQEKTFYESRLHGCMDPTHLKHDLQAAFQRIVRRVQTQHPQVTPFDLFRAWTSIRKNYFNESGKNNKYNGKLKFLNDMKTPNAEAFDEGDSDESDDIVLIENEAQAAPQELPKTESRHYHRERVQKWCLLAARRPARVSEVFPDFTPPEFVLPDSSSESGSESGSENGSENGSSSPREPLPDVNPPPSQDTPQNPLTFLLKPHLSPPPLSSQRPKHVFLAFQIPRHASPATVDAPQAKCVVVNMCDHLKSLEAMGNKEQTDAARERYIEYIYDNILSKSH